MTKKWGFAKERKKLIKFVETTIERGWKKHMATDIVDAIVVSSWEHMAKNTVDKEEVIKMIDELKNKCKKIEDRSRFGYITYIEVLKILKKKLKEDKK